MSFEIIFRFSPDTTPRTIKKKQVFSPGVNVARKRNSTIERQNSKLENVSFYLLNLNSLYEQVLEEFCNKYVFFLLIFYFYFYRKG